LDAFLLDSPVRNIGRIQMMHKVNFLGLVCGLVASIVGAATAQAPTPPKQLLQTDLKGVPGQEAMIFSVDFAPGQVLPWHMHPGGHELLYVVEGTLTVEDQNAKKVTLKPGEVNHIDPDVGHTARNEGSTPAKVIVIRVKDKDKPVAAPFQH
jgi:quercetin dioxygenase-like cupin family protein